MAGRQGLILVALALVVCGCEHVEPLRQGFNSTYHQDLRGLADDINRKEVAKAASPSEKSAAVAVADPDKVKQIKHWQAPPLLQAIQLRPPESIFSE